MLKDRLGNEVKEGLLALIDGGMMTNKMFDGVITFAATSDVVSNTQMPMRKVKVLVEMEIQIGPQPHPSGKGFYLPDVCPGIIVMPLPPNYPLAIALGVGPESAKDDNKLVKPQ
jgi:hypothetical protein